MPNGWYLEPGQKDPTMKIIAVIEEPVVIVRILAHLGLPARAPPGARTPTAG